jgi:hypothetical protein
MDDSVRVSQIVAYPFKSAASLGDALLLQTGGLGGAYAWTGPSGIAAAFAKLTDPVSFGGDLTIGGTATLMNGLVHGKLDFAGTGAFDAPGGFAFSCNGEQIVTIASSGITLADTVIVGRDPIEPMEVATAQYVTNHTVWSFNGRQGDIQLTPHDLAGIDGAPLDSPQFRGMPTAPLICDEEQGGAQIANADFVQRAISYWQNAMLDGHPFVWTFNGRQGDICLTLADVMDAGGASEAETSRRLSALRGDVELFYAPLRNPRFRGTPTAPTARRGTETDQIATTAFVMRNIVESTGGVVSFNTRSGAVTLLPADLNALGGPFMPMTMDPLYLRLTGGTLTGPLSLPHPPLLNAQATTKQYVDEAIAANMLWQGTWDAPTNVPDLTNAALHVNGYSWTIVTPDPTAPYTIPTTPVIAGLSGEIVYNGDQAIWSTSQSEFVIVHGSSLSRQEAQAMFLPFTGGTLTGPGNLTIAGALGVTGNTTLSTATVSGAATLSTGNITGIMTAPTAALGTNTTQLATTAFVQAAATRVLSAYSGVGAQRWIKVGTITTQTTTDSVTWNARVQTNVRTWPTGSAVFFVGVHTRSTSGASYTVNARVKYFPTSDTFINANGVQTFFYTRDGEALGDTVTVWCRTTSAGWTDLRVTRLDNSPNTGIFPDGTNAWLTAAPANPIEILADAMPLVLPPDPVTELRPASSVVNWADANHQWGGGYVLQGHMVDCRFEADGTTPVDPDMYYPIVFHLDGTNSRTNVRIELRSVLMYGSGSADRPYWATHARGFSQMIIWETQGEGWGATGVRRRVLINSGARFVAANPATHPTNPGVTMDPVMQITQNVLNSAEIIYVRGGGQYHFAVSHGQRPVFWPAGYTWSGSGNSYNAPPRDWDYFTQAMRDSIRPTNLQFGEAATRTVNGVVQGDLTGTLPYATVSSHVIRRMDRQLTYNGPNTNQWGCNLFTLPISMVSGLSVNIEIWENGGFWGNQQRGICLTSCQITGSTTTIGVNGTSISMNAWHNETGTIWYAIDDSAAPAATVTFYAQRLSGNTNRFDGNVRIRNYTGLNTTIPITWTSGNQAAAPANAERIPKIAFPLVTGNTNIVTDSTAPTTLVPRFENIAGSTDLNHYVTPGFYGCPTNAIAATIANTAMNTAFSMIVASMSTLSDTGRMVTQTVIHHGTDGVTYRMFYRRVSLVGGVGTTPSAWQEVVALASPPATGTYNLRATNGVLSWAAA